MEVCGSGGTNLYQDMGICVYIYVYIYIYIYTHVKHKKIHENFMKAI